MDISMYPFWYCFVYVNEHYVYMENSVDSFNLFNNDSYYFVCVKKYYMESTMDLFGEALLY